MCAAATDIKATVDIICINNIKCNTLAKSAMDAPDWLTKAYLEQALSVYCNDKSLKITALEIQPALGKGENFGGILTRVKAKYQLKHGKETQIKSYIVKTSFEGDEFAREKMKPYDIFNREMSIYENVLPNLSRLLNEIKDSDQLFAKAVHFDYARQALIFEDLSENGYVMADRTKGLDMQHVKLILGKLAKMHATSAVLNERQAHCLEGYDRGFFNRYTDTYSTYFVGTLIACGQYLSQHPEHAYYAKKLLALAPHYMDIGRECFEPSKGHINVLAHGDVWTNNVMFKYDSETGKPLDVLLIDFQYSFWGSPAIDLHHLFNTSLQEHIRLHQQDVLFQYYHKIFTATLRKLKYATVRIPSLREFLLQVEQKRFFALHSACVIQPVMINEDSSDADFNSLMAEDERSLNFKNKLYTNKKVQENLKNLLPFFDHRGLLEVNQCD